jgi:alkanesulfonate monooxygenase SsuD/methylene tetrahydromethanopterin reductase-like flavin-dependent oxidoreductase (luciferase family)
MNQLTFGLMGFCQAPYEAIAQRFRLAEELGFDSSWVDDDLFTPRYSEFEPWTILGALARDTSRIRIGTLVSVTTFRYPAFLAAQVLTVDHISGGRVSLGFGAGGPPNYYSAFGLDDWPPRERAERLEEQAAILASLLRGETVNHEGQHYRVRDANPPTPAQHPRPPFIIAAHGERGLRVTAHYADGWNSLGGQPYLVSQDPAKRISVTEAAAETRRLSERLDELCHEVGRDPSTLRRSVLVYRPIEEPLSSLDAFDEYVGRYSEIGIDEFVFYWPPLDNLFPRRSNTTDPRAPFEAKVPISTAQQAAFERVATDRILNRGWVAGVAGPTS